MSRLSLGTEDEELPTLTLLTGHSSTFISQQALQSTAITVEIWRKETDPATGGVKGLPSARSSRPTCSIPVCISSYNIITGEIFNTLIWEYISQVDFNFHTRFHPLHEHAPIPRFVVSPATTPNMTYFTTYLDDLLSPVDIPPGQRATVWINIPVKIWIWGYFPLRGSRVQGMARSRLCNKGSMARDGSLKTRKVRAGRVVTLIFGLTALNLLKCVNSVLTDVMHYEVLIGVVVPLII
ncbi:hypothetical protein EV426DRAFT_573078 [Tirmania nivea]|nr:hypothetical protein EV426DRAFT_573078 [Tirmania nivea]